MQTKNILISSLTVKLSHMEDLHASLTSVDQAIRCYLETPRVDVVLSEIHATIPSWPSMEIQNALVKEMKYWYNKFPPSKKWLSALLKCLLRDIEEKQAVVCPDNDDFEVSDSFMELMLENKLRLTVLDEREISYSTYFIHDSVISTWSPKAVTIKTMKSHNEVGTKIWEAGLFLAELITSIHIAKNISGKKILELGAGVGITSLIISKFLCDSSVTSSDNADDVLKLLQENIDINNNNYATSSSSSDYKSCNISALRLDWSLFDFPVQYADDGECESGGSPFNKVLECPRPDLILAADCTYAEETNTELVRILRIFFENFKIMKNKQDKINNSKSVIIKNINDDTNNNNYEQTMKNDDNDLLFQSWSGDLTLTLTYPCAIVACTLRTMNTFQHFLDTLQRESESGGVLGFKDISEICHGSISPIQRYYYDNRSSIKVIYIHPI